MLIIAGIDPGTSVGYCILDLEGNVIKVDSGKEISLGMLLRTIYNIGRPLAVGCDRKNIPNYVRDFSAKTGAVIVSPKEDLTFEEKKQLVKERTRNDHELDSAASARYAFNSLKDTIEKARFFSHREGVDFNKLLEIVIKKGINLAEAKELINKKEVTIVKQKTKQEDNTNKLIERMNFLEERNDTLGKRIIEMKKTITELSDMRMRTKKSSSKEDLIKLSASIKEKNDEINRLKEKICVLNSFLNERENIVVKKFNELNNIDSKDRIIMVENPQNLSEKEINKLKNTLGYIISEKKAKLPFIIIKKDGLIIKETDKYAVIDRKEFEKRVRKEELLDKIVRDYKESRA